MFIVERVLNRACDIIPGDVLERTCFFCVIAVVELRWDKLWRTKNTYYFPYTNLWILIAFVQPWHLSRSMVKRDQLIFVSNEMQNFPIFVNVICYKLSITSVHWILKSVHLNVDTFEKRHTLP